MGAPRSRRKRKSTGMIPRSISKIEGISELIQPHKFCGIYFLVYKNKVVYVGQSIRIQGRVIEHTDKKFSAVFFLSIPPEDLNEIELKWIKKLKPKYNRTVTRYITGEPHFYTQPLGFEVTSRCDELLKILSGNLGIPKQKIIELTVRESAAVRKIKIKESILEENEVLEYVLERGEWPSAKRLNKLTRYPGDGFGHTKQPPIRFLRGTELFREIIREGVK